MIFFGGEENKPNRLTTAEESKDAQYHSKYARWALGQGLNTLQREYLMRYNINKNFYSDKQWIFKEDLQAFFMDEVGNDNNRIKVTRNFIQPMVEQYRGSALKMRFDMKVQNVSPMAKSRRDIELGKLLSYSAIANRDPDFKAYMRGNNIPVGSDSYDTEGKFNTHYVDKHVIAVNRFLKIVGLMNNLEEYKESLSRDIALAGIGIMESYPYSGDWKFKRILPDMFGWDRSATSPTLDDAEYFFKFDVMSPSTIFEMYQNISDVDRKNIENYVTDLTHSTYGQQPTPITGKVPTYDVYWRDITVDLFGYVSDEFKQRVLKRINYKEPGEEKPAYTMSDLIPFDKLTPYQKTVLKGSNSAYLYVDLWRYCKMIPREVLAGKYGKNTTDTVLAMGILPYQEPDIYKPTNMKPPFKVGTWSYVDGVTLSPVDVAINPQRMINRFLSVMENKLNNEGSTGVVYDKDLVNEGEDEFVTNITKGKPVGINAKGGGIQNAIGKYDATATQSVLGFATLIENYKKGMEEVTSVNEASKGQANPDQLVGLMQLMIQRGNIMQAPFYNALTRVYEGCYQSIITSAKRYYIDNEIELIDIIGEESASILKLSKDMRNETMRIVLTPAYDPMTERVTVDQQLLVWIQFGLIDSDLYSKLYGKASMEEAILEFRMYTIRMQQQKRMAQDQAAAAQQQQAVAQDQAGQVVYQEATRDKAREDENKQLDRKSRERIADRK